MKKKYYVVKKGRKKGIFTSWDEIKVYIEGYQGAVYKSFKDYNEALNYLNDKTETKDINVDKLVKKYLKKGFIVAFTDGSYDSAKDLSSWASIILDDFSGTHIKRSGIVDSRFNESNNVSGEVFAAIETIKFVKQRGKNKLVIFHDYEGVKMWATKEWKSKKDISKYYVDFIDNNKDMILEFYWVRGHSNILYNEFADRLAKQTILDVKED